MSLYLVGENIDKMRSHYLAATGKLTHLMRGIYVDASVDLEPAILRHAVRIAHYLYPRAYLSAASAIHLGPTGAGKLFISGPRRQRTRIRNLEIIQNRGPARPLLTKATITDEIGEFTIDVSALPQIFLEVCRQRSEHAASVDDHMRAEIANRLTGPHASVAQVSETLLAFARANDWYAEFERADRYLRQGGKSEPVRNAALINLFVAWHGKLIGHLLHDGLDWRWQQEPEFHLPLVRQTAPGRLPPFMSALLPEGWLEKVLQYRDERAALRSGKRYLSNIHVGCSLDDLQRLPLDVLDTQLAAFTDAGCFKGRYHGPSADTITQSFEQNLADLYKSADTPRLSGAKIKAPMFLEADGSLVSATEKPFTHILKPAGTGGFEHLPVIEWQSLTLGRRVGFDVPAFALVPMPDGMSPALIIERFDIRQSSADQRMLALEDFCSLLDLPSSKKYEGTIEQGARALRALSTNPDSDITILFKRALFSWLIADGDMHLKNVSVLKTALPDTGNFQTVCMAPLYDAVTTIVFPGLENDRLALKLNGKDSRLDRRDFLRLAATIGLQAEAANRAIEEMTEALAVALQDIILPTGFHFDPRTQAILMKMRKICQERIDTIT